MLKNDKIVFN